jgi:hypothetical protein
MKLGIEGIIKAKVIYDKPIANIILNGENLKTIPTLSSPTQHSPGIPD